MKKIISILIITAILVSTLTACEKKGYTKYSDSFFDTFDTITQVVGYTKTEEEFKGYIELIHNRMLELHKLYDKYNTYEGINNIKTINDNAGIEPVKVEKEIMDLIVFSKEMYEKTGKETNIAMGPVLKIWSAYRDEAELDPENAKIPPMEDLLLANEYTDLNKVIVDIENSTVYLEDPLMSIDVGAVAKGFATEIITDEITALGFTSWIISAGGNIKTIGKPLDGIREIWGVGIQNPEMSVDNTESNLLETIFINDASVVSSGDYQRFYMVGDLRVHHLIDPNTLMPGEHYRSVNVITEDSGEADFLSTSVFLLPYDESRALVESMDGVEAIWVFKDGSIEITDGFKEIAKSYGATGAKEK